MKPIKQLEQLCQYYYLQMYMAQEMRDAYSAHAREDEQDTLYSLFEYEIAKDKLEAFWGKFEPHYYDAIALRNG